MARQIFTVMSPLGYQVALSRDRWREILRFKDPALKGHEDEVQKCLEQPEFVCESAKDPEVHLYYKHTTSGLLCVIVGRDGSNMGVAITAYFTDKRKKGREIWKS